MTYHLLDNKNPHGNHFYASSKVRKVARVMHITAGLQGAPDGHDSSAEKTARYAATTARQVSWHVGTDCDSIVRLLPTEAVAFHVKGYNSPTIGHEISKKDTCWSDENPVWVEKTLRQAAQAAAEDCVKHAIPVRHISKAQLDAAIRAGNPAQGGFISHATLDPKRRSDPGADFPWDRFLDYVPEAMGGKRQPEQPPDGAPPFPLPADHWFGVESRNPRNHSGFSAADRPHIQLITTRLHDRGWRVAVGGRYTPEVAKVIGKFQAEKALAVDGLTGRDTWNKLWSAPVT